MNEAAWNTLTRVERNQWCDFKAHIPWSLWMHCYWGLILWKWMKILDFGCIHRALKKHTITCRSEKCCERERGSHRNDTEGLENAVPMPPGVKFKSGKQTFYLTNSVSSWLTFSCPAINTSDFKGCDQACVHVCVHSSYLYVTGYLSGLDQVKTYCILGALGVREEYTQESMLVHSTDLHKHQTGSFGENMQTSDKQ